MLVVETPGLIHADSDRNRKILQACPSLHAPFRPTPWACNNHLQIALLLLKEKLARRLRYERVDPLIMSDGGTTAVEWLGLDRADTTPTMVLLHSVGGCAQTLAPLSRYFHDSRGWRVAACVRRGHGGLPLTAASFNTMGSTADLREQLQYIRERYPHSPLYGIGVSAGSGLLVRYLGEEGENSLLRAAVAYCPAYDIDKAFGRTHPFYSTRVTRGLQSDYIAPHADQFGALQSYPDCCDATNLEELHHSLYEVAGYPSYEAFDAASNPMHVIDNIDVPVLVINALDDPVCVGENVRENQEHIRRLPAGMLLLTRRGSHCAYYEGWRALPWAHRVMGEYLSATHQAL